MRKVKVLISVSTFAAVAFLAAAGFAQSRPAVPAPQRVSADGGSGAGLASDAYGTSAVTVLKIQAAAFRSECGSTTLTAYWDTGLTYIESNYNGCYLYAPVPLPAGARVTQIGFDGYDSDASLDIDWGVYWVSVDSSDTTGNIGWFASAQSGGSFNATATLGSPPTVDSGKYYFALVDLREAGQHMCVKGMRVAYQLQVSPAPGTATFTDVPTNYWAFQYVEALAASGITAGSGGGNFCPGATVTRDQMAVFLAKALGLHWPN